MIATPSQAIAALTTPLIASIPSRSALIATSLRLARQAVAADPGIASVEASGAVV